MTEEKQKKNRLVEAFTKDYKYEGLVLLVLSIIALVLGIYFLNTGIDYGNFGPIDSKVFFWLLIGLGTISLLLSIWPYYKPSIYEVKRISWPSQKEILENSITTFIFVIIFAIFFLAVDTGLDFLLDWIRSWNIKF